MLKVKVMFEDIGVMVIVLVGICLIEVFEKVGVGIIYGCCEGECCICLIKIIFGGENFVLLSILEDQVFKDNMVLCGYWLVCQVQIIGGEIVVKFV